LFVEKTVLPRQRSAVKKKSGLKGRGCCAEKNRTTTGRKVAVERTGRGVEDRTQLQTTQ